MKIAVLFRTEEEVPTTIVRFFKHLDGWQLFSMPYSSASQYEIESAPFASSENKLANGHLILLLWSIEGVIKVKYVAHAI